MTRARLTRARLIAPVLAVVLTAAGVIATTPGLAEAAGTTQFTTPGCSSYVVPLGVSQVEADAFGAQGGGPTGGLGGEAGGLLPVTPGETLTVCVGGQPTLGGNGPETVGGVNGGGTAFPDAFGGGGASDVRQGGADLSDRVIVAGGGGGTGGAGPDTLTGIVPSLPGGAGGGAVGSDCTGTSITCGAGGTASSGGAVGVINTCFGTGSLSSAGSLGTGGGSGYAVNCGSGPTEIAVGGGGGGGYYGGGAGSGDGSVPIGGGGGGGSGFVSASITTSVNDGGAHSGGGEVDITPTVVAPPAPSNVAVTRVSMTTASVAFVGGADSGTTYTVTCSPDAGGPTVTASGASSPIIVTGLTSGIAYQCAVTATNGAGSATSSASAVFYLLSVSGPGNCKSTLTAPAQISVAAGNASATVSWAAATSDPAGCIAGYVVTPSAGAPVLIPGQGTTTVIAGLTNGQAYAFTVAAENGLTTGPASAPSAAITVGTPAAASAPNVTRVASGAIKVSFKAPRNNGSAITRYTATCKSYVGTLTSKSGPTSPLVVAGLKAARVYVCSVSATNRRGADAPGRSSRGVKA